METIHDWNDSQDQSLSRDGSAGRRTNLTGMGVSRRGVQIGTKVELRGQKDNSEQQGVRPRGAGFSKHPFGRMELRLERLPGQGTRWGPSGKVTFSNRFAGSRV